MKISWERNECSRILSASQECYPVPRHSLGLCRSRPKTCIKKPGSAPEPGFFYGCFPEYRSLAQMNNPPATKLGRAAKLAEETTVK